LQVRRALVAAGRALLRLCRAGLHPTGCVRSGRGGMTDLGTVPAFRKGVKFRFDEVRSRWIVLAPEKLLLPDEIATEILKLVDGVRSIEGIVGDLAARFDAPRDVISADVVQALQDLSARGAIQL